MRPPAKQAENTCAARSSRSSTPRFNEAACKTGGKRPGGASRSYQWMSFNEAACKTGGKHRPDSSASIRSHWLQ